MLGTTSLMGTVKDSEKTGQGGAGSSYRGDPPEGGQSVARAAGDLATWALSSSIAPSFGGGDPGVVAGVERSWSVRVPVEISVWPGRYPWVGSRWGQF